MRSRLSGAVPTLLVGSAAILLLVAFRPGGFSTGSPELSGPPRGDNRTGSSLQREWTSLTLDEREAIERTGWFQLDRRLSVDGASLGKTLLAGTLGTASPTTSVDLAEDSFAMPPVGGQVLVREDDGNTARLATVSTVDGSIRELLTTSDRIPAAALEPTGSSYVYLVAPRAGGAIALRQGELSGESVLLFDAWSVPPLGFGTFQVLVSPGGDAALVEFCGESGCAGVYVDLVDRSVTQLDKANLGWAVYLAGSVIYHLRPDGGSGPLIELDVGSLASRTLADDVSWAQVGSAGGTMVVARVGADDASISTIDLKTRRERILLSEPLGPGGLAPFDLVGAGVDRIAGLADVEGWVVVSFDGQITDGRSRSRGVALVDLDDARVVALPEVPG